MFLFALSMLYCAWTVKIVQFLRNRTRNLVVNTFHHQAELAKKLAEAKEEFSANMSHEVRRLFSNISPDLSSSFHFFDSFHISFQCFAIYLHCNLFSRDNLYCAPVSCFYQDEYLDELGLH